MILPLIAALAAAASAGLPAGSRYVSLGSSYAAGPGVGTLDPASGACGRSMSNYARQVAARRHLRLVDAACSGATTANILDHGQHGFPAQIAAVTSDTRLVTVLIGGNDIDYVGNLGGLTCRDTGGVNCHVRHAGNVEASLAVLPASLDRVIAAVRQRAPAARIVLVGYLPAIPASGPGNCAAVPLTPADAAQMRDVAIRLAQAIGGAAKRNSVDVVRSTLVGKGHDACAPQPFVAGFHPAASPGWPSPVPYHPNQAGMNAIAAALNKVLNQ